VVKCEEEGRECGFVMVDTGRKRCKTVAGLGTWAGGGVGHMRCSRAAERRSRISEQRQGLRRRKYGHPFAHGPLTAYNFLHYCTLPS